MRVALSRIHHPVTTLGPGRRIGLWLQGCSLRCPGCISVDTWPADGDQVEVSDVVAHLARLAPVADGLTVSGGEPFEQPEALAAVLRGWRKISDGSTLVFTGREFEGVRGWLIENDGLVDAVMTGPFRSDLPQTMALRGSDNQALHVLTERGAPFRAYERRSDEGDRRLDVMFDDDGTGWFAGIPSRGDLAKLRRLLAAAGHQASTSAMVGGLAR